LYFSTSCFLPEMLEGNQALLQYWTTVAPLASFFGASLEQPDATRATADTKARLANDARIALLRV
jgi:hypothetical protein